MDLGDGVVLFSATALAVLAVVAALLQQRKIGALSEEARRRGARAAALEKAVGRGPAPHLVVNRITGDVSGLEGVRGVLPGIPADAETGEAAFAGLSEAVAETDRPDVTAALTALGRDGTAFDIRARPADRPADTIRLAGERLVLEPSDRPLADLVTVEDLGAAADLIAKDGLDRLPVPIWSRDREARVEWLNREAKALFGEDGRDLMGETLADLGRRAANRTIEQTSSHVAIRNGERRLLEVIETAFSDGSGTLGTAFDMTGIADAQAQLDRQIDVHDQVLESLDVGIFLFDADKRLRFFNQALLDVYRVDEALMRGRPKVGEFLERLRAQRILPEVVDFPAFKRTWESYFTKTLEPVVSLEHLPDGRTLKQTILPHPQGGILCMLEDATDRLALERSFNTLVDVQRATLDNLREGAALFGEDHRLKVFNPAWANLWNLTAEDLEGEPHFNEIVEMCKPLMTDEHDDWERQRTKLIGILAERTPHTNRFNRPDGVVVNSNWVPLPDGAMLVTQMDISDTVKFQKALTERAAALEAADRIKSAFIANISYDLRTPLTAIVGFADILEREYFGPLNERQKQYASAIRSSSERLSALINNMLDLASLEAGYLELNFAEVDLSDVIADAVEMIGERARSNNVRIKVEAPPSPLRVEIDPQRIIQALFNVLDNAISEVPTGQKIAIESRERDQVPDIAGPAVEIKLVYTLESREDGLPPEEPMTPTGARRRTGGRDMFADLDDQQSGGALSLALVRSLVEIHGGQATSGRTQDRKNNAWVRLLLPARRQERIEAG